MSDIEPIKGKVIIEYDGSGVGAAKKDLESLADIVGGGLTESTGHANEALSSLDEQMGKSAESTASLTSSVGSLEKPLQHSGEAVISVTEALGEHQAVIENTGKAYEALQSPIESTAAAMQYAVVPSMAEISQNAQDMQKHLGSVNSGFAQMSDTLSQSVPLLPQMASGMHSVSEQFDPKAFGLDVFNENFSVFQDALANPYPYQMIHQYLNETGQTWDDFSSSIGSNNAAFLDQMAAMPVTSQKAFGAMSSGAQGVGQSFVAAAGQTEAFNQQWASMAENIDGINKEGGVGTALYGPSESWNKLDKSLASTEESIGKIGAVGGAGEGGLWSGLMGGLHNIAMPLMAVQMIGMAVGQVSQGIYNMAALAEGPAAHSVGSFTGAIDVMGQHAQKAAEQFSEGLGQGIQPMIDAMNNVSGGQNNDFWGSLGNGIGQVGSLLGNVVNIVAGGLVDLGSAGFTLNPSNPVGNNMLQSGWEGLANQFMGWIGQPEPYPTTGGGSSQIQIDLPAIQQSLTQSIAVMNAQATNPQYLAAQAYLQSQAGYAQLGQAGYDISHTSGQSAFDYTPQSYQNSMAAYALANGGSGYGLNAVDLNRAYFESLMPPEPAAVGGCFPAGTPVLLSDGTTQAIETLQIDDQVLAHDGEKQVVATVRDRIVFPAKRVYTLTFSDDNILTLTDSHPVSTLQGWKSLSPESTKKENPGLFVMPLQIGDVIITLNGTCTLTHILILQELSEVYNITTDGPHTYYANNILVHNAKAVATQIMNNVANSTVPQADLKNSNLIQSLASNFTGADLSHTFTANVSWVGEGLTNTFTGNASWVGQNLQNAFTGAASWIGQGLSNTFTGFGEWIGQNLEHGFSGIASWAGQGLTNTFSGVASWLGLGLTNTFTGFGEWIGQNLEHTFTGIASWIGQGLSQTFSVPGFAAGVQNFSGGLAVVGEYGPELVHLPQGSSVYPQSATGGFPSLDTGVGNNSAPLTITINHTTTLDGKVVAQSTIPYVAPLLRTYFGVRQ